MFTVPLFRRAQLPMDYATGTAVALTPAVALVGTLVYMILGWSQPNLPWGSLGFCNFPVFLVLVLGSFWGVHWGMKLSHRLKDALVAKLYLWILGLILLSMLV